ncbi:acid phosphatase [Dipodascopsis tothii]|uniref:acid phosphatase n=1 Tax=Dipodascopsis tothii TaxID=44089 RepID=UPI0034CD601C
MLVKDLVLIAGLLTSASAQAYKEKPYSQEFYDSYSVLKHYGGNGPYSNNPGVGISRDPPSNCEVDQVMLLSRHGERFPDPSNGAAMEAALAKVTGTNKTLTGSLAFVADWEYFVPGESWYAQETWTGPYNGLADLYQRGNNYRNRYGHLWDGASIVPIFSSGYERIINSARAFGQGFLGYNYTESAALNIISESNTQGADSLTPSCYTNADSKCTELTNVMPIFYDTAARLNAENGLNLNVSNIYSLMQMAAFELNARKDSPWIHVFTEDEWYAYGYTQDLQYYHCYGPGSNTTNPVGAVYANATLTLLNQGPKKAGSMFWNFCHDTNITPVLSAMGISVPTKSLPLDQVPVPHQYRSGDLVPMGGHLVLERMTCKATTTYEAGTYVRVVVNEAVIPIDDCQTGPGYSCGLNNYTTRLQEMLPDFATRCQLPAEYPQYLDFFWNYNKTNTLNYQNGPISYQEGFTTV